MPEVFVNNKNPSPHKKFSNEEVLDIRLRFSCGEGVSEIWKKNYINICGRTTIYNICHNISYKNI